MNDGTQQGGDRFGVDIRWSLADILLGTALVAAVYALLAVLVVLIGLSVTDVVEGLEVSAAAAVGGIPLLAVVWALAVRKYKASWIAVGLRGPTDSRWYWLAPGVLVASLLFTALYATAASALGVRLLEPQQLPSEAFGAGVYRLIAAAALAGWVPFVEEVFFRGFVFGGLAARFGVLTGAMGSSALFALVHMSIGTMIPIFVTGLLFAWAYSRTRSLWIPISAHAGQNLFAVLFIGTA